MKTRILGNFFLPLIVSLTAACGSGDSSDKKSQFVEITSASRCAIRQGAATPDNCMSEKIEGGSYVTDQNAIHLRGISSAVEDDGCPEPTLGLGGPICFPTFPYNYGMGWINSTNGASGNGNVAFIRLPNDPVGWSTYDPKGVTIGYADPKGVPLEMGSNTIQINTGNSGLRGNAQITITRVVDVTPPTVHHIDTYRSRIVVFFSEQLDPASIVSAINVFDINAQPIPGTSEFNPLKLEAIWRPQSNLSPASSYTARISGVTDWAPNVMIDPYEWSFTTRPSAIDLPAIDPITIPPGSNTKVTIAGAPFCDDLGGTADFGCRIVPQGAPPNIGLTVANDSASISIEIVNQQHIELIDTDGEREKIAIAVFVTNSGADSASVSMRIGLTDENGISQGYAIANTFPFEPGFSGLVAFTANPNFQNVSPMIYHGMLLEVEVAGGPLTFGEFSQANIFPVDPTSHVGN
jgi:hypothetical protein